MDEMDIIKRLGPPAEIVSPEHRMRSRAWVCSTCRETVTSATPIPVPAPCPRCGGIVFETIRSEPQ
jgi:rubrerythrin